MSDNVYLPKLAEIINIKEEVEGARAIKTFQTKFVNGDEFSYRSGQCAMISIFGRGESMISIASTPLIKDYLEFSIMKSGRVTSAIHDLNEGDIIGVRGPYGNIFPMDEWHGKDLVFVGGGIGVAPIWSVLQTALGKKEDFGKLTLLYGARSAKDFVYKEKLEELRSDVDIHLSIDNEESGWQEYVGFVPNNVLDKKPSADNAIAITCGPPIMIKFVIQNLLELGFKDEQIYTTVENKMKCGIGKCGRCNIGVQYVCQDGPVYSWAELKKLPPDY